MRLLPKQPVKTLIVIAYIAVALLAVQFVLPRALRFFAPFILAYVISVVVNPMVGFLQKKLHFPRKPAVLLTMLLVIGLIALLLFTVIYQAVYEMQTLAYKLPALLNGEIALPGWITSLSGFYHTLPASLKGFIDMIVDSARTNLSDIVRPATTAMITAAGSIASALPSTFVFAIVLLLATYFIANDREHLRDFFATHLPEGWVERFVYIKNNLFRACGGYFKAQLTLMSITFTILLVGFSLLGLEAAVLLALLIAIADALPILGTGICINPWAIFCLLQGNYRMAASLFVLYLIATLTRQLLEPRIVGSKIGLHPLITLMSMYIGLKSVGVFGMILGPIIAIIVISFFQANETFGTQEQEEFSEPKL